MLYFTIPKKSFENRDPNRFRAVQYALVRVDGRDEAEAAKNLRDNWESREKMYLRMPSDIGKYAELLKFFDNEALETKDAEMQTDSYEMNDEGIPTNTRETRDGENQTALFEEELRGMQTDAFESKDEEIQTNTVEAKNREMQPDTHEAMDEGMQFEVVPALLGCAVVKDETEADEHDTSHTPTASTLSTAISILRNLNHSRKRSHRPDESVDSMEGEAEESGEEGVDAGYQDILSRLFSNVPMLLDGLWKAAGDEMSDVAPSMVKRMKAEVVTDVEEAAERDDTALRAYVPPTAVQKATENMKNKRRSVRASSGDDYRMDCTMCKSSVNHNRLLAHAFIHSQFPRFSCGICNDMHAPRHQTIRRHHNNAHPNMKLVCLSNMSPLRSSEWHLVMEKCFPDVGKPDDSRFKDYAEQQCQSCGVVVKVGGAIHDSLLYTHIAEFHLQQIMYKCKCVGCARLFVTEASRDLHTIIAHPNATVFIAKEDELRPLNVDDDNEMIKKAFFSDDFTASLPK